MNQKADEPDGGRGGSLLEELMGFMRAGVTQ